MIVSGTGHRPDKLGGYSDTAYKNLVAFATKELNEFNKQNEVERLLSGMALGWDQALCQACINLDIPFTACIPFMEFDRVWPRKSREYYQHLVSKSAGVVVVSSVMTAYSFQRRNEFMVDNSETVLALWNGSTGGTKNCLDYCIQCRKPYINLWDSFEKFSWENK